MEKQAFIDLLAHADIADTETFAFQHGTPHQAIADYCKSLLSLGHVSLENITHQLIAVNAEGKDVAANGSPEARVLAAVHAGPKSKKDLEAELGAAVVKPGFGGAMKAKLVALNDEKNVAAVEGAVACGALQTAVQAFEDASNGDPVEQGRAELIMGAHFTDAKKRKLLATSKFTSFKVTKTASFTASAGQRKAAELTKEDLDRIMKLSAEEQEKQLGEGFKPLNLNSCGARPRGGHLHPLLKVRTQIRDILLHMGFSEMKTNNFVESGFWNFDTLFQPQQHPARDAHDTFFLSSPESTDPAKLPHDYVQRVKEMHERGGHGSIGWRYDWSLEEACKNILRTHTTAVSARTLYQVAREYKRTGVFKAHKYFSIDRVFRNETLDATHLAEFHQVEGLVADRGLGLGHLIGTIKAFFARMGINKLRFKPAYNPYTEPSLEIFGYHPMLQKWVEVGNSGVFRPEMLMPMGLPEDVRIIAWGISVERPTMIQYGIPNIRELFGHQLDVEKCAENPICWYKAVEVKEG